MTEAEWMLFADPQPMLHHLEGKVSDRKLRLFACACCRDVRAIREEQACRQAVVVAEAFADGLATAGELAEAAARASAAAQRSDAETIRSITGLILPQVTSPESPYHLAANRAAHCCWLSCASETNADREGREAVKRSQSEYLRDVIGNPFRPVSVDPLWRTPRVVMFAQAVYEERAFERLPWLAEALEETGCDNEEMLAHLRGVGPHVRGCWVVDLLLGRV